MYVNNRGYRRRKLRVTGRFYAFLTVMVVLAVMVGVLIANRSRGAQPPQAFPVVQQPVAQQPAATAPAVAPATAGAQSPGGQSAPGQQAQGNAGPATVDDILETDPDLMPPEDEQVDVADLAITPGLPAEWRNILLLGNDSRNIKKVSRTDTILIAAVNTKTGEVKLTSIMRDLVVPVVNKKGETKSIKINSAIGYGGPKYLMRLINQLFGTNIKDYAMVNFSSFQKVIDKLDGIRMNVTAEEMAEINKSLGEQAKAAGMDQTWFLENKANLELKTYGQDTLLTGIQALGYARIRHVGSGDYQRTERQRLVLDAVLKKVKDANAIQLMQIATGMWGEFETNIDMMSAVGVATSVIKNGAKMDTRGRIPYKGTFLSETRGKTAALWDCDFEANKARQYQFVYVGIP